MDNMILQVWFCEGQNSVETFGSADLPLKLDISTADTVKKKSSFDTLFLPRKVAKKLLLFLQISNENVTFVPVLSNNTDSEFMKINELTKLLREKGCYCIGNGKRHDQWFSPLTGATFPVPRHGSKEVPNGTLSSILKQAGIN